MKICASPIIKQRNKLICRELIKHVKKCFSTGDLGVDEQASLYVHWPYCRRNCSYCNFNKYVSRDVDEERIKKCLVTETKTLLQHSGVHRINSIFFGGGTPSLADPSTLLSVIDAIKSSVKIHPSTEITLEVNPTKFETDKLRNFKSVGINRVSIGVQALNNDDLSLLGRQHTAQDGVRCVTEARKLFPNRVSLDVMFGRPNQTLDSWKDELKEILTFCDDHVSLYQLTLEKGTKLYKWVQEGLLTLPSDDCLASMYRTAVEILSGIGLNRYEVSNFSKQEAECKHNWSYWTGGQYIAVGPGAHGRFVPKGLDCRVREARVQTPEPSRWMSEVERDGHATRKREKLKMSQQMTELLVSGMRTREGISHEISRKMKSLDLDVIRSVQSLDSDNCSSSGEGRSDSSVAILDFSSARKLWSEVCPSRSLYSVFQGSEEASFLQQHDLMCLDHRGLKATKEGLAVLDSILYQLLVVMETVILVDQCSETFSCTEYKV